MSNIVVSIRSTAFGNRIEMIKAYRTCFQHTDSYGKVYYLGLKEAKEACDEMAQGKWIEVSATPDECQLLRQNGFILGGEEVHQRSRNVTVYREPDDRKIQAIKDFRYCVDCGLREAKTAMDEMYYSGKPVSVGYNIQDYQVDKLREKGFTVYGVIQECFLGQEDLFEI